MFSCRFVISAIELRQQNLKIIIIWNKMAEYFPMNHNSTRWLTEEVFKLIDLVQRDEAIYNPRHKYYFCRPYVENFWREVDQKLDKNPGASLAKWTNLRISFRREFTNYLEEQVPPCWSYFDRMFFLHPYLRKKQQPNKSGELSLQESISKFNNFSNRLERVRESNKSPSSTSSNQQLAKDSNPANDPSQPSISDNYFDFYDEPNNSELDDIMEDDQQSEAAANFPQDIVLEKPVANNEIKSECEIETEDDDYEKLLEARNDSNAADIGQINDMSMRSAAFATMATRLGKRTQQQMRLEHLNRLQTRSYYEDLRAKRSRSPERQVASSASSTSRVPPCTTATTTNISFVRPTFTKSTDTISAADTTTTTAAAASTGSLNMGQQQMRHNAQCYTHHLTSRMDNFSSGNLSSSSVLNGSTSNVSSVQNSANTQSAAAAARQLISPTNTTAHLELCDCKTDPDAMFLMSLLPDIQKLNGRDRGKIKIAFQNILQDYLYPD